MLKTAIILIIGFCLVHLCKMLRLYLVLMEHQIPFVKFVLMYVRTTFVNLIVPFKLGEAYRFMSITRLTHVWQVGILSIVLDRFFDIVALLLILLPIDLAMTGTITGFTLIVLFVVMVLALGYLCVLPSYTYLNHYIIANKTSKRALMALRGLDVIHNWYQFTKKLITGRSVLIILASLGGWICEAFLLKEFASSVMHSSFRIVDFGNYIKSIFIANGNPLLSGYTKVTAVVFLGVIFVTHVIYIIYRLCKRRTDK